MPLFEINEDELTPFRRVPAGPDLFEQEIEDLMWANLESFVGKPLFPVKRQPSVSDGLRPDIVALGDDGRVYVIEIKRDIDRRQLAQCLEYAGWARNTGLDELASMYHEGAEAFFPAWIEFTQTASPVLVRRPPEIVLVARDFDARTDSALSYLTENDLPITVMRVTVYQDNAGRRFIDVDADHEIDISGPDNDLEPKAPPTKYEIDGRRVEISDLIDAGLLTVGARLTWHRPRSGDTYIAAVGPDGQLILEDGRPFASPSRAAIEAAEINAYDGWRAWCVDDGRVLADLRDLLLAEPTESSEIVTPLL